jgi:hypothetical protein
MRAEEGTCPINLKEKGGGLLLLGSFARCSRRQTLRAQGALRQVAFRES